MNRVWKYSHKLYGDDRHNLRIIWLKMKFCCYCCALFSPESDFYFFLWFAYSDKAEHFQVVSNKIKNNIYDREVAHSPWFI